MFVDFFFARAHFADMTPASSVQCPAKGPIPDNPPASRNGTERIPRLRCGVVADEGKQIRHCNHNRKNIAVLKLNFTISVSVSRTLAPRANPRRVDPPDSFTSLMIFN